MPLLIRKPEADERPAFVDIMIPLQKPDFQVLNWSEQDTKSSSTAARTLGSALEAGLCLYKDLQRVYLAPAVSTAQSIKEDTKTSNDEKSGADEERQQVANGDGYEDDGYEVTAKSNGEENSSPSSGNADTVVEDGQQATANAGFEDDGYDVPPSDSDQDGSPTPRENTAVVARDDNGYSYVVEVEDNDNDSASDGYA